jgi:uncharacterized protein with HEPN domain
MLSERAAGWFADIVKAATLIETWLSEAGSVATLMADEKARSAVERQLLIISEAEIRLWNAGPDTQALLPQEIDWAGVRGMGNVIRHRYDDMDFDVVADVLASKLGVLKTACERVLRQPS